MSFIYNKQRLKYLMLEYRSLKSLDQQGVFQEFIGTLIDDVPIFNFAFVVANAVVFISDLTCRKHGASKRRYYVTVAS